MLLAACSEPTGPGVAPPETKPEITPEHASLVQPAEMARPRVARAGAPSVLLVTVDTLRADRLGAYGYPLETSPNMDALAERGTLFVDATVQWPKTWPSLASFLTGSYPRTTGVGAVPRILPASLQMMAEVFRDAGFDTAAVVSNFNAGRALGFDQGFDSFTESWQEKWEQESGSAKFVNAPGRVKEYTNATLVTDQALRWLWGRGGDPRPFFLWVHYMDPHGPYIPPSGFDQQFADYHAKQFAGQKIPARLLPPYQRQYEAGHLVLDLAFYQAQYDREIRYLDGEIGRLLETVGWSTREDMLIVLTADHGESLGEHDYYLEHGALSYQPTARVPLIVALEGTVPAGQRIERAVGLVDVSATMVELAGLSIPRMFEGTSLAGALRGDASADWPQHVFMQSGSVPNAPQLSVREGRWKLIRIAFPPERKLMTGNEYELYDLVADPGETTNVAAAHQNVVERLVEALDSWYASRPERIESGEALDVEALDSGSRALLEALGYLQPEGSAEEPGADAAGDVR